MSAETSPEFGKLRNFFWPIHRDELKLFLPLLIMYFLICLNYSILRTSRRRARDHRQICRRRGPPLY